MDPSGALAVGQGGRGQRVLPALALLAAVATTLLSGLQIHLGNREQQAHALAARHAVKLYATVSGSGLRTSFAAYGKIAAIDLEIRSLARQFVAIDGGMAGDIELVQAQADKLASVRATQLAESLGRPPSGSSGLDAATRRVLAVTPADSEALVAVQNRLVGQAERTGRRADRVVVALTLTAAAAALFGVAGSLGTAERALTRVGLLLLLVGVCDGASALFW
jgi:hypothetical protein